MKRRVLASGLLPLALVLAGVTAGPSTPAAATGPVPIRIMFNGDSITQQFSGDYSWRYRLIREIQRQGTSIDMIGPFTSPSGADPRYHTTDWDPAHFAVGGAQLHHFVGGGYDIGTQLAKYPVGGRPQVMVSFLGNNDLTAGLVTVDRDYPSSNPALTDQRLTAIADLEQATVDHYKDYVAEVRAQVPDEKIVLGQVYSHAIPQGVRDAYNGLLAAQVVAPLQQDGSGGLSTPESPISLAMLDRPEDRSKWESNVYTMDLAHPTPTGELLMAQRFGEAMHAIAPDVLPEQSAIKQVYIPWNPPLVPTIRVYRGRIYVNCLAPMHRSGILQIRIKLVTVRTGRAAVGSFVPRTSWYSARLRPGYYRIRVQGLRGFMSTPWTRAYTVKVPAPRKRR